MLLFFFGCERNFVSAKTGRVSKVIANSNSYLIPNQIIRKLHGIY